MNFEDAVACMKRGKGIKRKHWKSAYLMIDQGKVKMRMGFRKPWYYQFKNHDIIATDWLIAINHAYEDDEYSDINNLKPLSGRLSFNES